MNSKKDLDVIDPFYDAVVPGSQYDVFGLINARVEIKVLSDRGCLIFKVPLRLGVKGSYSQSIIEIWSSDRREEPVFTPQWTRLQLAYIRNVKFLGLREKHGIQFYQFTLPQSPGSRFIWLTDCKPDFWMFPIPNPDDPKLHSTMRIEVGDSTLWRGFIGKSRGSVINPIYSSEVHTSQLIGRTTFANWHDEIMDFKKYLNQEGNALMKDSKTKVPQPIPEGKLKMHL